MNLRIKTLCAISGTLLLFVIGLKIGCRYLILQPLDPATASEIKPVLDRFVVILALAGVGIGVVLQILLERVLLLPLGSLSQAVRSIDVAQPHDLNFDRAGQDEIAQLATEINTMLQGVQQIRSESQATEAALRQSQQLLRTIIDSVPAMINLKDAHSRYLLMNAFQAHLYGVSAETAVGKTAGQMLGSTYGVYTGNLDATVIQTGKALPFYEEEYADVFGVQHKWLTTKIPLTNNEEGEPHSILTVAIDVTELKQAQEALRQSQQMLQLVMDNIPLAITWKDQQGLYLGANRVSADMLGLISPDELVGQRDPNLPWPPACVEQLQALDERVMSGHKALLNLTLKVEWTDGRVEWLGLNKIPLREHDQVVGILTTCSDITDRVLIEKSLRQSEARYRQVVEAQTELVHRCSPHFYFTFVNSAYCQSRNQTAAELVGQSMLDGVPLDEQDQVRCHFQSLTPDSPLAVIEERHLAPDGQITWQRWTNRAIFDDQGQVLEYQCVGQDITDRKLAEQALQASESKYRDLVQTPNSIIMRWNRSGVITFINEYGQRFFDYQESELLGQHLVGSIVPEIESSGRDLHQMLEQITEDPDQFQINENENICRNGERVWITWANQPVFDQSGQLIEILSVGTDSTQRRQMEEALRKSEAHLRAVFDAIPDVMIRFSHDGICLSIHAPGYFPFLNQLTIEIGQSLETVFPNPIAQQKLDAIFLTLESGQPQIYEFQLNGLNGSTAFFEARLVVCGDAEVLALIRDITDRKQAEQALRQSETLLRMALGAAHMGAWSWDISTPEEHWSPETCVLLGFPPDRKMTYADFLARVHPEDWSKVLQAERQALESNADYYVEFRIETATGEKRWLLNKGNFIRDDQSRPLKLAGVSMDITARKQAETQLQQAKETAEAVNLISQAIATIFDLDAMLPVIAGDIVALFKARNCGIGLLNADRTELTIVADASTRSNLPSAVGIKIPVAGNPSTLQVLETKRVVLVPQAQTNPIIAPLHEVMRQRRTQCLMLAPLLARGEVIGTFGVATDESDRVFTLAEQQLLETIASQLASAIEGAQLFKNMQQAREAAEAANRAKSTFLANMSHELRTPLNAILGFSQLMARDPDFPQSYQEFLRIINQSGEHLLNLINDVLEVSKIEAGRIELRSAPFDLFRMLQTLQDMFRIRAQGKQLHLSFEVDPSVPQWIDSDESKIRQILINLLSNAVKFTDEGDIQLRASFDPCMSSERESGYLQIAVQDTGVGIDPDEVNKLFQPFSQTESGIRSQAGTGLGLVISRTYARMMDGDITVESCPGKGSTFWVKLQVKPADWAPQPPAAKPDRVISLAPGQPTYRILVVEDKAENRDLLVHLLNHVGFETQVAINGLEAIECWERWDPHLIWMDIRMPIMDGCEATRQIRSRSNGKPHSPIIIALTAHAFEEQHQEILAAGCDDLLSKPFSEADLFTKMAEHLGISYLYANYSDPEAGSPSELTGDLSSSLRSLGSTTVSDLTPDHLSTMSLEWIQALHRAAIEADLELIPDLIQQIPSQHADIAQTLAEWVDTYRIEKILALTSPLIAASTATSSIY